MHAPISDPRLTRLVLVDGELHHVIGQSTAATFADLNYRRAWQGLPPVSPSSTLTILAHDAAAQQAVRIRTWRNRYGLRIVGGRR